MNLSSASSISSRKPVLYQEPSHCGQASQKSKSWGSAHFNLPTLARLFLHIPVPQLNHKRRLLPQKLHQLLIPPRTLLTRLQIKMPQHPSHNRLHLKIRKLPRDTGAKANAERLPRCPVIILVLCGRICKPTLRHEGIRVMEVSGGVGRRPVAYAEGGLSIFV